MMSPPEGLKHLNGKTPEEMLGTFTDYARCDKKHGEIIHLSSTKEVDIPHGLGEG